MLEGEVSDVLKRDYYSHGADDGGYRNGYRVGRLKTAEGEVQYAAPQVSDRAEPFRSQVREVLGERTAELERLAVEMYARGLSTRDIEAATRDENGQALLSKSAVPHAFGERPLMKLMFAATIRASERWHGIKSTAFDRQQLEMIRKELAEAFRKRHAATNKNAPSRVSSSTGT
jgi:hypothetical protein